MIAKNSNVIVIGSGVAGISASYLISQNHNVVLLEKESRLGGHTNTRIIEDGPDAGVGVDTGFIVLNDRTYPHLHRFFELLGVDVRYSDMSFGLYCEQSGLQYAAPRLNALFAQRANIFSPRHYGLIWELARFNKIARADLEEGNVSDDQLLHEYLDEKNISPYFVRYYLIPMAAAIWSSPDDDILHFPLKIFLRFFFNHGLLHLFDRPRWQTVVGGSHSYLKKFKEVFTGKIQLDAAVTSVQRSDQGVQVTLKGGEVLEGDYVVFATHADQVLPLLSSPTEEESKLLSDWSYQKNHTILHTDKSFLPPLQNAWASWNYRRERGTEGKEPLSVTYHMNRLQGLQTEHEYCVTLNGTRRPAEDSIHYEIEYEHPVYTKASVATQEKLAALSGTDRTYYCGSYFGFGFHEDAITSGVAVGKAFGGSL